MRTVLNLRVPENEGNFWPGRKKKEILCIQYGNISVVNQLLFWDVKVVLKLICTGLHSQHTYPIIGTRNETQ